MLRRSKIFKHNFDRGTGLLRYARNDGVNAKPSLRAAQRRGNPGSNVRLDKSEQIVYAWYVR